MAQTTHMPSVDMGDRNVNSSNITHSFNSFYKSEDDVEIMRWLSPLEPNNRHQGVRTDRFAGIGDWHLKKKEFQEWRGSKDGADKAVLFCSGNPGVGKTYLRDASSLVIDTLRDQNEKENIAVAGLYYDFLSYQEQAVAHMMGAILKQLISCRGIPNYLREAFQKREAEFGGRGLRLADLMGMLRIAIALLPQVFICIDVFDERLPKRLSELLESLRDIVRESPSTRIFLTRRLYAREDVRRTFIQAVMIPISPSMDDIRNYLEIRLDRDPEPEAMSNDLRADIVMVVLEKISHIFLLVSLNIGAILGEVTIRHRRKKSHEMRQGNGLSDACTATLARLTVQKGYKPMLGLKVLMWVLYSERLLRTGELCHALGVEAGSGDLDPENLSALQTLLVSCLGLVTVEPSLSTARLVHFTLQEHLPSDPTLFHSPHLTFAEVCLTYLNFDLVRDLSPTLLSAPVAMPLLEYASSYWAKHVSKGMTRNAKILALRLLAGFDEHISAQLISSRHNNARSSSSYLDLVGGLLGFSRLHEVASPGAVEIAAILVMIEWDASATDSTGSTAPTWADRGHEVAKALLELKDVNFDLVDSSGRTPLSWVAGIGCAKAARALLQRKDVNPNRVDSSGRTPLSWAAGIGCEGAVKAFLKRKDVNPNPVDSSGRTPLLWAAEIGCEGAVKALLERKDVNPNQVDSNGRTPLLRAAEIGCAGTIKALLKRKDVNPNLADSNGRTPLSWAAGIGCEGAVKALLGREDVEPDLADSNGRTPLFWAASKRDERIVKLFLERRYFVPDPTPPISLRIVIDVCFFIIALFFLSYLLPVV